MNWRCSRITKSLNAGCVCLHLVTFVDNFSKICSASEGFCNLSASLSSIKGGICSQALLHFALHCFLQSRSSPFALERQQMKGPPYTITSTYLYSLCRKKSLVFIWWASQAIKAASSGQSWVSRVHWWFKSIAPERHRSCVRAGRCQCTAHPFHVCGLGVTFQLM